MKIPDLIIAVILCIGLVLMSVTSPICDDVMCEGNNIYIIRDTVMCEKLIYVEVQGRPTPTDTVILRDTVNKYIDVPKYVYLPNLNINGRSQSRPFDMELGVGTRGKGSKARPFVEFRMKYHF